MLVEWISIPYGYDFTGDYRFYLIKTFAMEVSINKEEAGRV